MKKRTPPIPPKAKKRKNWIWIVLVILCLALIAAPKGKKADSGSKPDNQVKVSENSSTKNDEPEKIEQDEPEEAEPVYAKDEVVNDFIKSYNAISSDPFSSIEKGNIRTKYNAMSQTYYFELLNSNATDKIKVTIDQTDENADKGVAGMRDVFHDVILAIDPSLSEEDVYSLFDDMLSGNLLTEREIGNITVTFCPDKDLSNGASRGHITISEHQ